MDPQASVNRAVVTYAHSDHARWGCRSYLEAKPSESLLRMRMKADAKFEFHPYVQAVHVDGVHLSFHPAGHFFGSRQVRLEYRGQ